MKHDAQKATCTEIGWKAYVTCTRCDYTTYEESDALGHDRIPHSAKAATCTDKGWNDYVTCSRCDYTTYEEIAALGHVEVVDPAKEPTCTEKGLTEGKHCSRCNTVLVAQNEVSAKGHVYGDWKVVTPATEDSEGKKEKVCACGDKVEEILPKLEKQSGCKSSVVATVTVVAIVSVLGSAVVLKKKD